MRKRSTPRLLAILTAAIVGLGSAVTCAATAQAAPRLPTNPIGTPTYTVNVNKPGGPSGYIFYTTGWAAAVPLPVVPRGLGNTDQSAVIVDKTGRVVWRYTVAQGGSISNFRTQTYQGRKVLTWWEGSGQGGHGAGVDVIADTRGHIIKKITPAGLGSDVHEFRLTPDGRALITSYHQVSADLTSVGGPKHGTLLDCVASVVDVASGRTLTEWSALQHIPLTASAAQYTGLGGAATFDPFHMNSIVLDPVGNLLISFRNLNAAYNIDARTGQILWSAGGSTRACAWGPEQTSSANTTSSTPIPTRFACSTTTSTLPPNSATPASSGFDSTPPDAPRLSFDAKRIPQAWPQPPPAMHKLWPTDTPSGAGVPPRTSRSSHPRAK